ncbi:MAG: cytochrome C assembly family protein [Planctomycetota bacterium]|jgi:ABC-type uncharacterized transport system permease subunit
MQAFLGFMDTLLPISYLLLWGSYFMVFYKDQQSMASWSRRLLVITVILHLATLATRVVVLERLPMAAPLEFFSLLALAILAIYALIEKLAGVRQTGFVVIAFAFLLQFLSSAFTGIGAKDNPLLHEAGFVTHAILVLLAYTSLSVGFLYALLYLAQARQLARRNFGLFYRRMPALDTLERMSVGAVKLGVPLMFAALVMGHLWMNSLAKRVDAEIAGQLSHTDPKIVASWITVLAYTVGLVGHHVLGWRGRRMNILAISAFLLVIISMAVIHHFFPSFHNFSVRGEV